MFTSTYSLTIKIPMYDIKIGQNLLASPKHFHLILKCDKKKHVIINEIVKLDECQ